MDSAAIQPSDTDEAEIKDVSYLIKCHLLYLLTLVWFPKRCAEIMEMFLLFPLIFACLEQSFTKWSGGTALSSSQPTLRLNRQKSGVCLSLDGYSGRTEALRVFMPRP